MQVGLLIPLLLVAMQVSFDVCGAMEGGDRAMQEHNSREGGGRIASGTAIELPRKYKKGANNTPTYCTKWTEIQNSYLDFEASYQRL